MAVVFGCRKAVVVAVVFPHSVNHYGSGSWLHSRSFSAAEQLVFATSQSSRAVCS